jgi:hypothetical protein
LTQDFRSSDFQLAQEYVVNELDNNYPSESGYAISTLPPDARGAATIVITFYITLGAYVAFGLADEKLVIKLFGYRADQAWIALEALIMRERELRQGNSYASFFEDLVCRNRKYYGETIIKTLRISTGKGKATRSAHLSPGRRRRIGSIPLQGARAGRPERVKSRTEQRK